MKDPIHDPITILCQDFQMLESWEDKYSYIIELGEKLPPYPDEYKTDAWRVHGCLSRLWVMPGPNHSARSVHFLADSDALISKGLAALILLAVNHKPANEVAQMDFSFLHTIGLGQHLSPSRANGLRALVNRVKELAAKTQNGIKQ
ncbi:MAG: SufE family protein [Flavobacteriales bacterium]|nr:SufE family protein [Flavobacteriales bacterium]